MTTDQTHMAKLIGIMIRHFRHELTITQTKLAELSDKTFQVISNMERGVKLSDPWEYTRVAKALNITLSTLVTYHLSPKAIAYITKHKLNIL